MVYMEKHSAVHFDREKYIFVGIDQNLKQQLKERYYNINIEDELRKMALWLTTTTTGKARTGTLSFIKNWLNRYAPSANYETTQTYRDSTIETYLKDYLQNLWQNREHLLNLNTISR